MNYIKWEGEIVENSYVALIQEVEKNLVKNKKAGLNQLKRLIATLLEKHCNSNEALNFVIELTKEILVSFPEINKNLKGQDYAT